MRTDFEFFLPIEKSGVTIDPGTGDIMVTGPISTERRDLQGERVLGRAVESGLDTFIRLNKPIDWNHLSTKNPTADEFEKTGSPIKFMLGHGERLFDGPAPGGGLTKHLTSRLYAKKKATQDCLEHLQAGGKLYYSIGGSAERDGTLVKRTNITHVAITPYPANPDCEIGLVGLGALAKSMGITEEDRTANALDISIASDPTNLDRLIASIDGLNKTLVAGSGSGMGSTGGRALVTEDLEGDGSPKTACKCNGKCRCKKAPGSEDDSSDDNLYDTSPDSPRDSGSRKGHKNMSKTVQAAPELDQATRDELVALETDPKLGPIAKALSFFSDMFKNHKPADASEEGEGEGETPEGEGEDDYSNTGESDEEPLGKGFTAYGDPTEQVMDVSLEQFNKELIGQMDTRFERLNKSLKSYVKAEVAKLGADIGALNKSIAESTAPALELMKTLEQLGMRPQPTGQRTGQNYRAAESGVPVRSRQETIRILQKGIDTHVLDHIAITNFELHGLLPEPALLKSLE